MNVVVDNKVFVELKTRNEEASRTPARPAVHEERADMMMLTIARSGLLDRRYDHLMLVLVYCISLRP